MAIEEPPYVIEKKIDAFEIRKYSPYIIAEVSVKGTREVAINQGFRVLANYIFGDNRANTKIVMTAPVTQTNTSNSNTSQKIAMTAPVSQIQAGNEWIIRFSMPAKYTMATIPIPNDAKVKLKELPSQKFAVIRFSGLSNQSDIDKHTIALDQFMISQNLKPNGTLTLARYDPPWTLWFMRRNELMVAVD